MLREAWGLGLYPSCNQFYQGLFQKVPGGKGLFQNVSPAGSLHNKSVLYCNVYKMICAADLLIMLVVHKSFLFLGCELLSKHDEHCQREPMDVKTIVGWFSLFCEDYLVLVLTSFYENLIGSLICKCFWAGEN
jgi:hypothetical protein